MATQRQRAREPPRKLHRLRVLRVAAVRALRLRGRRKSRRSIAVGRSPRRAASQEREHGVKALGGEGTTVVIALLLLEKCFPVVHFR